MIRSCFFEFQFKDVILQARNLIRTKEDDGGDNMDKIFQSEVKKAVQEINSKLDQCPKVNSEELKFVGWRTYLVNSANLYQLDSRKKEILVNIQEIRQQKGQKGLEQLRKEAIQQIREELAKT